MTRAAHKWICCQVGAREHYAVPRALHRRRALAELITDYWMDGSFTSGVAAGMVSRLAARHHEDLADASVKNFNAGYFQIGAEFKLLRKTGWDAIVKRNLWFQSNAKTRVQELLSRDIADVVFSYSYAAKELFEVAREAEAYCVLGQIDPGLVEWELVDEIRRQHGFEPIEMPPDYYWNNWHAECELADMIVVNSNWSKKALIKQGICEQKIRIIPLAYELDEPATHKKTAYPDHFSNERPLEILFLGQVIPRKGIIELIGAIEALQKSPVQWTLVGNGELALMNSLNQFPNVKTVGQIDRQSVVTFYQQSDVFILPTHSDGFAITLLEATAHGLPIIASPFCGDVVNDGVNGIELPEVTSEAIIQTVRKLLGTPKLLCGFAKEQRERKRRTIDDLANDLTNLFAARGSDA